MEYRLFLPGMELNRALTLGLVADGQIIDGDMVSNINRDSFSGVYKVDISSDHKYIVEMNDLALSNEFNTRMGAEYFVRSTLPGTSDDDLQKDHFYWPSTKARGKIKVKITRVKA